LSRRIKKKGKGKKKKPDSDDDHTDDVDYRGEADASLAAMEHSAKKDDPDYCEYDLEEDCEFEDFECQFTEQAEPLLDNFSARRSAIAYFYVTQFKCPPKEEWGGHGGTI
jgi:hypothetical protein